MDYKTIFRRYYILSKPGIVYSNTLTAIAGYLYASVFAIDVVTFGGLTIGILLLVAGACAYNNYLDRRIDAVMARTQKRGLVTGSIAGWQALTYATATTTAALLLLTATQNRLTVILALIAFIDYVVLYGLGKRKTVHGTLIGTVSGALPLMLGYTAVAGRLDTTAWLLFILMFAWQMAHFYAIALYRLEDYRKARIPVMPAMYGAGITKLQTVLYIFMFIVSVGGLMVFGTIGWLAGGLLAGLGLWWLIRAVGAYDTLSDLNWGKQTFFDSLTVVMALSICVAVGPLLV